MFSTESRRRFFKQLFSLSAFSAGSILSVNKNIFTKTINIGPTETYAMGNPDYAMANTDKTVRIEYIGMSCFMIKTSKGIRILTDPYKPEQKNVFHTDLKKEPADVVTISCGHGNHCSAFCVGGIPYIFKRVEPIELHGIKFRGVASRHLAMGENKRMDEGDNFIICFEVDGIKICHLGALGHKLSDDQVKQIGKVDILMVPVGGVSTLPLSDANEVCEQLNPKVIFPMHYKSERCTFPEWCSVDDFIKDKKNVFRCDTVVGSSELEFRADELPSETKIVVPRCAH